MASASDLIESPGPPNGSSAWADRLSGLDWWAITAAGFGLLVGGKLGWDYTALSNPNWTGMFPPTMGVMLSSIGLVIGLMVLGVILAIPSSTQPFGVWMMTSGGFVIAGFIVGSFLGPKWQPAQVSAGHVRLELVQPAAQVLEANATCTTPERDSRIGTIEAMPLGRIGIDELRLSVFWMPGNRSGDGSATIRLRVNTSAGYEGSARVVEASGDRRTGRATFEGLESSSGWIGGNHAALAGSITWDCSGGGPANGPLPSPTERVASMQGWFHLHGIVTVDDDLPGPQPTPPFEGQASGTCSPASELRTDAIETVVTWVGGQRARLRLVPEPTKATLTIDLGDGSTPETATAPATVRFLNAAKTDRELSAVFQLRAGRLELKVDWWCGE
jgi:hypothetical protein